MPISKKKQKDMSMSYEDRMVSLNKELVFDSNVVQKHIKENELTSSNVKTIAQSYTNFFERYVWASKIRGLKNYFMYNGDRGKDLCQDPNASWRSNEKTGITKIITDLFISKIFSVDFNISTRKRKMPEKDKKSSKETPIDEDVISKLDNQSASTDEQNAFIDWVFADSQIRKALQSVIFDNASSGAGYALIDMNVSDSYIKMEKKVSSYIQLGKEMDEARKTAQSKYYKVQKVNSIFKYIPIFNVIYEYDKDFEDSSFVGVYIYEGIDRFLDEFNIKISQDLINYIKNNRSHIFGKDYNKIKMIKSVEEREKCGNVNTGFFSYGDKGYTDITNGMITPSIQNLYWGYGFEEPNIDRREFYLHYTRENLVIMCGDVVIYNGENPVGCGIIPVVRMSKENYGNVGASLGTTEILEGTQNANDLIVNSANDNIKMMMNPKFYTNGYANVEGWENGVLPFEPRRIYKGDIGEIKRFDVGNFDYNSLRLIDHYRQQGIMLVGLLNKYGIQYQQQKPEQTSGNGNIMLGIAQEPLKQIVNGISLGLTKAFKIWSILAQKNLPNNIKIKIEGDGGTEEERSIKIKNLLDNVDILYVPEAMTDYTFQTKINNLTQYANFLAIASTDPTSGINYSNYANLNKEFANLLGIKGGYQSKEEFFDGKDVDLKEQNEIDKKKIEYDFEIEKIKIQKQNELLQLQIENQQLQQRLAGNQQQQANPGNEAQYQEEQELKDKPNDIDVIRELLQRRKEN